MIKIINNALRKITAPIDRNNLMNLTNPEIYSYREIEEYLNYYDVDELIICEVAINIIINFSKNKDSHNIFSHLVNHSNTIFSKKSIEDIKKSFIYWNKPEFEVYFLNKGVID
jgi:hypothetical protein